MHGIIFAELRRYAEAKLGADAWVSLTAQAGAPGRLFQIAQQFPDSEFHALLEAVATAMGAPPAAVLEELGEFIAPDLLKMHAHSVRAHWRTLDLIEHTELAIHQVIREGDSLAQPPRIAVERASPHEVVIDYRSPRKLCALAKGIVRGVARHYGEPVDIRESTCMLAGADCCRLAVSTETLPREP